MVNISHESDILAFWKNHQDALPLLSNAAKTILAIPATSSKSERVFSTGTRTVTNTRSRLTTEKAEDLIVIKENQSKVEEFKANTTYKLKESKKGVFSKFVLHTEEDMLASPEDEDDLVAFLDDIEEDEELELEEDTD